MDSATRYIHTTSLYMLNGCGAMPRPLATLWCNHYGYGYIRNLDRLSFYESAFSSFAFLSLAFASCDL